MAADGTIASLGNLSDTNSDHVDRHCVARTRRDAHSPRCTMSVIGGTLAFNAHAGVDKVQFAGRLPRHHKLRPGAYTLVIVATDTAGQRSPPPGSLSGSSGG